MSWRDLHTKPHAEPVVRREVEKQGHGAFGGRGRALPRLCDSRRRCCFVFPLFGSATPQKTQKVSLTPPIEPGEHWPRTMSPTSEVMMIDRVALDAVLKLFGDHGQHFRRRSNCSGVSNVSSYTVPQ